MSRFYLVIMMFSKVTSEGGHSGWTSKIIAMMIAIGIGFAAWKRTGKKPRGLLSYMLKGGLIIGAIAFAIGFFGPMIFIPQNNLGPLIGIVYTGPIGFMVGLLAGALYWYIKVRKRS